MNTENKFLTIKEASKFLGLSTSTLYTMVSEKKIPYYKPNGKKLYFKRTELEEWIEQGKVSVSHED